MTEDSQEPVSSDPSSEPRPTAPSSGSYQLPADYYAAPPSASQRSGCPRWVPIGCGLGGCLVLIVLFAGGAMLMRSGSGHFTGWFLTQLQQDLERKETADVTPAQRDALRAAFSRLQATVAERKLGLMSMPRLLEAYRSAAHDGRITPPEAESLTAAANEVSASAR